MDIEAIVAFSVAYFMVTMFAYCVLGEELWKDRDISPLVASILWPITLPLTCLFVAIWFIPSGSGEKEPKCSEEYRIRLRSLEEEVRHQRRIERAEEILTKWNELGYVGELRYRSQPGCLPYFVFEADLQDGGPRSYNEEEMRAIMSYLKDSEKFS